MDEQKSFPYLQLLGIVAASLVVTVIIFWVWHVVEMRQLKTEHQKQNGGVRSEIATLESYVATLSTSTPKKVK